MSTEDIGAVSDTRRARQGGIRIVVRGGNLDRALRDWRQTKLPVHELKRHAAFATARELEYQRRLRADRGRRADALKAARKAAQWEA